MQKAVRKQELCYRNSCSSGTVYYDRYFFLLFACDLQGVQNSGKNYYGCSVLVVMKDRDIKLLLEALFDLKAAGSRDILEIDPAEAGS